MKKINKLISQSKRPIILAGNGIKLANAVNEFKYMINRTGIPFVTTWNTHDLYPCHIHMGVAGLCANETTQKILDKCDLIIGLGTHFSLPLVGRGGNYLPQAKKIVCDIDKDELKNLLIDVDLKVNRDVKEVMEEINVSSPYEWTSECASTSKFPTWDIVEGYINPYRFIYKLSSKLDMDANITVDGGGTIIYISFRAIKPKPDQNIMIDAGIAAMGSGLPNAIGAYFANRKQTICLCGDGSLQMNIQELQTLISNNIPVKIFLMNNSGYLAIRHTQAQHLDKRYIGSSSGGGMSLPDYKKVAKAYGIKYFRINNEEEDVDGIIDKVLKYNKPVICEFMVHPDQEVSGGLV